ncbi:MAG TPA: TIM44-like domain-containing protein [Kofleriaceae bacterium]|nr:TIM44-like domain-containing protein [Kofleriaceae bacterium]
MRPPRTRWLALALLLLPAVALARPGGGDSYSGGGGHSSGGGGGGYSGGGGGDGDGGDAGAIFELIVQLIRLCYYYPKIGVPLVLLICGYLAYAWWRKQQDRDWDSGPPVPLARSISDLGALTRLDPDFSRILFEDFAFRLYATAHGARGRPGGLDELAPYLAAPARAALAERSPPGTPVAGVAVGAMRLYGIDIPTQDAIDSGAATQVRIGLEFEANYTVGAPGAQRTKFAVERWLFSRSVTARTRPPTASRTFPCPNCGAPWQDADAGHGQKCAYCGEVVDNGRFDWQVEEVMLHHERDQPPTLTTEVPERGTDLASYVQVGFDQRWLGLLHDDPALTDASLIARLHHIYAALNQAWAADDLTPARAVVSDGLHDYLAYWLGAYRAQGLRNVLEGMRLTHQALIKLTRDRWYDALTIRIWGTGRDYVVRRSDGAVVRGSPRRDRRYSEYWTLIRSAARRGAPRGDAACGNCGAPLVVSMAGACLSCGVHVTAGEFDWVLSKIEQDDSYRG